MMNKLLVKMILLFLIGMNIHSFSQNTFLLTCNNEQVPVYEQNDVDYQYNLQSYKYTQLIYEDKPLEISVDVSGFMIGVNDWEISPRSRNVQGILSNNVLQFTISNPGYYVIRFAKNQDFTKRLVIFVDTPYPMPKGEIVNIKEQYHVDNTGKRNETSKIQKALDDISGNNATLYFPPGIYSASMLRIRSNSKIHFAQGARLLADPSFLETYYDNDGAGTNRFIYLSNVENIQITGLGGFDGNGTYLRGVVYPDKSNSIGGMRVLLIVNSQNILFDGILLKDAARWNTQIVGSSDITFRYCKMMNNPNPSPHLTNFDGWDPDASQRVLIENCFGWAGDDNVAIKCVGTGTPKVIQDVEDIIIRNCVFLTKKSSLKIGTETRCGNIKRITFENNDVVESDRAMAIDVQDQAVVDGVLFKNNRVEYWYPDAQRRGININLNKRNVTQDYIGKILNVRFEDCSFDEIFPNGIRIYRNPKYTTSADLDVTFKNVRISGYEIKKQSDSFFDSMSNGLVKFE